MAVPGRRVEVQGLLSRPNLNGKSGSVSGQERDNGRIPVLVDGSTEPLALKPSSVKWLPSEAPVDRAGASGGKLVEDAGRTFSNLLDNARIIMNHTSAVAPDRDDICEVLRTRPDGFMKLQLLTSQMYSRWKESPFVYKGLKQWILDNVKRFLPNNIPEVIQWLRKAVWSKEVSSWGEAAYRISGEFWVVEEREEGCVLVAGGAKALVCVGLGIADSIAKPVRGNGFSLPCLVSLTLLPFQGRLVYDGVLNVVRGAPPPPTDLRERVMEAERTGALVTFIPMTERPAQVEWEFSDGEDDEVPLHEHQHKEEHMRPLTDYEQELQRKIARFQPSGKYSVDSWVFRRMDYTEEENPNHMGMIINGAGMCFGAFHSAYLDPSALELVEALVKACEDNKARPEVVSVDCKDAVVDVRCVLRGAGIKVEYYPPPCNEETEACMRVGPEML